MTHNTNRPAWSVNLGFVLMAAMSLGSTLFIGLILLVAAGQVTILLLLWTLWGFGWTAVWAAFGLTRTKTQR